MGNIGRPSTGCFLCRKRRVKCDEGRPGCHNCARLKKPCPGYREADYGLIRSTLFISNDAESRSQRSSSASSTTYESPLRLSHYRAGSSSSDSENGDSPKSDSILRSSTCSPQRLPPLAYVSGDFTEQSVCYSLSQLDVNSRVLYSNRAFDFLPEMLSTAGQQSYLYAAMRSVAAVNFANRSPTMDMHDIVELEYARAVSQTTTALADPVQCLRDETLIAVWLLGIRELLVGVNGSQRSTAHQTHIDGTLMLLRLRGEEQFSRPLGRHLYATLLSAMHWKPLFASEEPSQEYLMLESQLSRATSRVPEASLRLRSFFHGVSKLRSRIKNFLLVKDETSMERSRIVDSYLKAAARLEDKVNGWCNDPSWNPRKVFVDPPQHNLQRTPWTSGSLFRTFCFGSWEAFFHWNRFFVAKICLHAALLDALSTLPGNLSLQGNARMAAELIVSHTAIIQETVQDFLGILVYALGDVDKDGHQRVVPTAFGSDGRTSEHRGIDVPSTLQVQAPLAYLIALKYLGPGQREAIFLALQRIRAEFRMR